MGRSGYRKLSFSWLCVPRGTRPVGVGVIRGGEEREWWVGIGVVEGVGWWRIDGSLWGRKVNGVMIMWKGSDGRKDGW